MDLFFLFYNLLLSWFSSRVSFFNLLAAFNLSSVRFSQFFGILCFFGFGFSGFFSFNLLSFYSFCQILVSLISHSDLFYRTILFPQSFIRLLTGLFSSFHFPLSSSSTSKFHSPPHEWAHWFLSCDRASLISLFISPLPLFLFLVEQHHHLPNRSTPIVLFAQSLFFHLFLKGYFFLLQFGFEERFKK